MSGVPAGAMSPMDLPHVSFYFTHTHLLTMPATTSARRVRCSEWNQHNMQQFDPVRRLCGAPIRCCAAAAPAAAQKERPLLVVAHCRRCRSFTPCVG